MATRRIAMIGAASLVALAIMMLPATAVSGNRTLKADPEGTGVLPFAGGPTVAGQGAVLVFPTPGLVMNAEMEGIGEVGVAVMSAGGVVTATVTDEYGAFIVNLPTAEGLDLAIPALGVGGIDVQAGVPILVIVR